MHRKFYIAVAMADVVMIVLKIVEVTLVPSAVVIVPCGVISVLLLLHVTGCWLCEDSQERQVSCFPVITWMMILTAFIGFVQLVSFAVVMTSRSKGHLPHPKAAAVVTMETILAVPAIGVDFIYTLRFFIHYYTTRLGLQTKVSWGNPSNPPPYPLPTEVFEYSPSVSHPHCSKSYDPPHSESHASDIVYSASAN